jgi:tetratricopeptide (TPR) repeat protein
MNPNRFWIPLWLLLPAALPAYPAGSDEESRVRAALETFGQAMADQDREAVAKHFHLPRLVQELHERGGLPLPENDEEKERLLRRYRQSLPLLATGPASVGVPWEKIRTLSVKLKAGEQEAEALGIVRSAGSSTKVRFWLAREGAEWKIFDMEFMEFGIRLSMTAGSIAAALGKDDEAHRSFKKALGAILKAIQDLTSGEFELARQSLEVARAAKPPGLIGAWIDLMDAQALHLLDRHEEAIQAADRALAVEKNLAVCHFVKAASYAALEDYERAIATEKEFLRQVGDDPEAWGVIGDAYEKRGKAELAMDAYRKGAASDDEDHSNRFNLGRLLIESGKVAEAKPLLREASRLAPPDEETFEEAATLLDGVSEFAAVLELAEERVRRTPDEESVLVWQGRALRKLGRLKEAEKVLNRIPAKDREDGEAQDELVFVLAQAGRDRDAKEEAGKRLEGDEETARYLRLFLAGAAGRTAPALEDLKPLLETDESYADRIRKEPALEKFRMEDVVKKALQPALERYDFKQAVQKLPSKDREGMLRLSEARAKAAPADEWAFYYQGFALRRLGRFEEAQKALTEAVRKSKRPPDSFRDELGRALAAQGKIEEALAQAEAILKSDGSKVTALTLRAVASVFAKKPEEALKLVEEILKENSAGYAELQSDPDLGELRKLPAFQELLKKAKEEK